MNTRITLTDLRPLRALTAEEQSRVAGGFVRPRNGVYCYWYRWRGRWYRSCPRW